MLHVYVKENNKMYYDQLLYMGIYNIKCISTLIL